MSASPSPLRRSSRLQSTDSHTTIDFGNIYRKRKRSPTPTPLSATEQPQISGHIDVAYISPISRNVVQSTLLPLKRNIDADVQEMGGLLTPPPTKERDKKRRNLGVATNLPRQNIQTHNSSSDLSLEGSGEAWREGDVTPPRSTGQHALPSTPSRLRDEVSIRSVLGSPGKRRIINRRSGAIVVQNLPGHLKTLILLHQAFSLSLGLWLATHPPVLPPLEPLPSSAQNTAELEVDLDDLTTYLSIKATVEKTCARRFGISELRRLAWVWAWDDSDKRELPELQALEVEEEAEQRSRKRRVGDYSVTLARTIDPVTQRKTLTHGIGIRLRLTSAEVASMRNSIHAQIGINAGMAALGRWNAGSEERGRLFEAKIWKWWEICKRPGSRTDMNDEPDELDNQEEIVPNVPMANLPKIPQAVINFKGAVSSHPISRPPPSLYGSGSSPHFYRNEAALHQTRGGLPGLTDARVSTKAFVSSETLSGDSTDSVDVFGPVKRTALSIGNTSVADRRQALYERIKARTTKPSSPNQGRSDHITKVENMTMADTSAELKRRSTLSRLEAVAEGVWMLFSTGIPGVDGNERAGELPTNLTSSQSRRKALPMSEVMDIVVKSSKTPISAAEARDSLTLLTSLCPNFLLLRSIHRQEWLEMPPAVPATSRGGANAVTSSHRDLDGNRLREVRERIRKELESDL